MDERLLYTFPNLQKEPGRNHNEGYRAPSTLHIIDTDKTFLGYVNGQYGLVEPYLAIRVRTELNGGSFNRLEVGGLLYGVKKLGAGIYDSTVNPGIALPLRAWQIMKAQSFVNGVTPESISLLLDIVNTDNMKDILIKSYEQGTLRQTAELNQMMPADVVDVWEYTHSDEVMQKYINDIAPVLQQKLHAYDISYAIGQIDELIHKSIL